MGAEPIAPTCRLTPSPTRTSLLTLIASFGLSLLAPLLLHGPTFASNCADEPPLPADTRRGLVGTYGVGSKDWTYDPLAYSVRYRNSLERMTVLATRPVRSRRIRIVQPRNCGAPIAGLESLFRVAELEIYERDEVDQYLRNEENLVIGEGVQLFASDSSSALGRLRDGVIVCPFNGPFWSTSEGSTDHWIEVAFPVATSWNQIVLYWPVTEVPSEGVADAPSVEGQRSSVLEVYADSGSDWVPVEFSDLRPAALHDGSFTQELLGLELEVSDRLAHAEQFARWHHMRPRNPLLRPDSLEVEITSDWRIVVPEGADGLIALASDELRGFLREVMSLSLPCVESTSDIDVTRAIVLSLTDDAAAETSRSELLDHDPTPGAIHASDPVGSHSITVDDTRVLLAGVGERGVRYAAMRLIERLGRRRAPFVKAGTEAHRPAFEPRIAASFAFGALGPDGLGFPDWYLSLMAQHYLDGIYVFQNSPFLNDAIAVVGTSLDENLSGDPRKLDNLRNLVSRAAAQGLDVYWCLAVPGAVPASFFDRHPEIRGANRGRTVICLSTPIGQRLVSDTIERLVRAVPGLGGLVVLRTELNQSCGGRLNCPTCKSAAPGRHDPMQRVFDWVHTAAASVDSTVRVIAFDWRAGNMPPIYETFLPLPIDYWVRPDTTIGGSPENHVAAVGPNPQFTNAVSEYSPHRKLWIELQTSHLFPFHGLPSLPIAPLVDEKLGRVKQMLRTRSTDSPMCGLAIGNGSGLWPYPVTSLVTQHLAWTTTPIDLAPVESVATDWYGPSLAPEAAAVWRAYSEVIADAQLPKYVTRAATRLPPWDIELNENETLPSTELAASLRSRWLDILRSQESLGLRVPEEHRRLSELELQFSKGAALTLESTEWAIRWIDRFGPGTPPDTIRAHGKRDDIVEAIEILTGDLATCEATLRLFSRQSAFRFHPYYRNSFGLPVIADKQRALKRGLAALREEE